MNYTKMENSELFSLNQCSSSSLQMDNFQDNSIPLIKVNGNSSSNSVVSMDQSLSSTQQALPITNTYQILQNHGLESDCSNYAFSQAGSNQPDLTLLGLSSMEYDRDVDTCMEYNNCFNPKFTQMTSVSFPSLSMPNVQVASNVASSELLNMPSTDLFYHPSANVTSLTSATSELQNTQQHEIFSGIASWPNNHIGRQPNGETWPNASLPIMYLDTNPQLQVMFQPGLDPLIQSNTSSENMAFGPAPLQSTTIPVSSHTDAAVISHSSITSTLIPISGNTNSMSSVILGVAAASVGGQHSGLDMTSNATSVANSLLSYTNTLQQTPHSSINNSSSKDTSQKVMITDGFQPSCVQNVSVSDKEHASKGENESFIEMDESFSPFPSTPVAENFFTNIVSNAKVHGNLVSPNSLTKGPDQSVDNAFKGSLQGDVFNNSSLYGTNTTSGQTCLAPINRITLGIKEVQAQERTTHLPLLDQNVQADDHILIKTSKNCNPDTQLHDAAGTHYDNKAENFEIDSAVKQMSSCKNNTHLPTENDTESALISNKENVFIFEKSTVSKGSRSDISDCDTLPPELCLFDVVRMLRCSRCSQLFSDTSSLIEHYKVEHLDNQVAPVRITVSTSNTFPRDKERPVVVCQKCGTTVSSKTLDWYLTKVRGRTPGRKRKAVRRRRSRGPHGADCGAALCPSTTATSSRAPARPRVKSAQQEQKTDAVASVDEPDAMQIYVLGGVATDAQQALSSSLPQLRKRTIKPPARLDLYHVPPIHCQMLPRILRCRASARCKLKFTSEENRAFHELCHQEHHKEEHLESKKQRVQDDQTNPPLHEQQQQQLLLQPPQRQGLQEPHNVLHDQHKEQHQRQSVRLEHQQQGEHMLQSQLERQPQLQVVTDQPQQNQQLMLQPQLHDLPMHVQPLQQQLQIRVQHQQLPCDPQKQQQQLQVQPQQEQQSPVQLHQQQESRLVIKELGNIKHSAQIAPSKLVTSDNPFLCSICLLPFKKWRLVQHHLWSVHGKDVDMLRCGVCFTFKANNMSSLLVHQQTHSIDKPFTCQVCKLQFRQLSQLINHRRIHDPKTPATSNTDGRPVKRAVKKALRHVCDLCNYKTDRLQDFKTHARTHSKEQPFECGVCGCRFNSSSSHHRHMLRHLPRCLLHCPLCEYDTSLASNFMRHFTDNHADESEEDLLFQCGVCVQASSSLRAYTAHSRTHHKDMIEQLINQQHNT